MKDSCREDQKRMVRGSPPFAYPKKSLLCNGSFERLFASVEGVAIISPSVIRRFEDFVL